MADAENLRGTGKILIMGIGNLLLGDDGIGVHALHKLETCRLPDDVELLDVGTAFIDAVSHVEGVMHLIILDAVQGGGPPGSVYRIEVNPDEHTRESISLHGISIINILKFARSGMPESITILGVEPAVIDWSMDLSDSVETAKPLLIDAVLNEIDDILDTLEVRTA